MKTKIITLLAMFFTSYLSAAPTPSEVNAVLTKYADNPKGWSVLNYAIEQGDIAAALILVDYVRDFNRVDGYYNPVCRILIKATQRHPRILSTSESSLVDVLLQKGANVKWEKTGDQTPLYYAVQLDDKDLVSTLLEKGANINEHFGLHLDEALRRQNYTVVKLLISKGTRVDQCDNYSPLFSAIGSGDVKIMRLLLKKGANPNAIQTIGLGAGRSKQESVLDQAVMSRHPNRDAIVDLLLQYGAKLT